MHIRQALIWVSEGGPPTTLDGRLDALWIALSDHDCGSRLWITTVRK